MILGKIASVSNDGVTLIIDGETSATKKKYAFISTYYPAADDRVIIEEIADQYVIIGKITSDPADAGQAKHAETADNATHATKADTATSSNTATSANTATVAGTVHHVHNFYLSNSAPTSDTDYGIQFKTDTAAGTRVYWRYCHNTTYGPWHELTNV